MISFTTDLNVAQGFAGPDDIVYQTSISAAYGYTQTLPGAGEQEILIPNMIQVEVFGE
jgi:hypothetical protein